MEHESNLHVANGLTETQSVAANPLGDDDAFIEVPALRVGGEQQHQLGIVSHAAQAFFAAEHEPHVRGFQRDLAFAGLEEVASDGGHLVEFNRLQSGHDVGPGAPVDAKRGQLTFESGKYETAYNRAQEEEWQHE